MSKRLKDKQLRDETYLKSVLDSLTDDEKSTFCDFIRVGLFGAESGKDYEKSQEVFKKMGQVKQEELIMIIGDATFLGAVALDFIYDSYTHYISSDYANTNYEDFSNNITKLLRSKNNG